MSETEIEKMKAMMPQIQMMSTMFKPLQSILEKYLEKFGIRIVTNKVVYFKDRDTVMFGVQLVCPNSYVAEKVALALTGKSLTVKEGEKEVEVDVGEGEEEAST